MKILVVAQSKDIIGGANRSLLEVIEYLKNEKCKLTIISPGLGEFSKNIEKLGLKLLVDNYKQTSYVNLNDRKDFFRKIRTDYFCIKNYFLAFNMARKIKKDKFGLVYINDTTNSYGYYLSRILSIPFVWHFRGYQKIIKKYFLGENIFKSSDRGHIIAISNAMKNYMINERKIPNEKISVVYNGLPYENNSIKQPWELNLGDVIHFIECGHISKAKGQKDAVEAFRILKERGINNIMLHIVGTPLIGKNKKNYIEELKKLIKENKLEQNIIFEGELKNVSKFRDNMQVELVCSECEPFGRVTVEGLQKGLVVIGANTGATPEIIKNDINGLLYKQGSSKDLANKINKLLDNPELGNRLSKYALKHTKNNFTFKKNKTEIFSIIQKIYNEDI